MLLQRHLAALAFSCTAFLVFPATAQRGMGNMHAPDGEVLSGEEVEFVTNVPHDFHELQRRAITHDRIV